MSWVKRYARYLPLVFLLAEYVLHAGMGFLGDTEYYAIVHILGFSSTVTTLLVYAIGPLDTLVATLLWYKDRLIPTLPWSYLYLWVGLWPWLPRFLEWRGGLEVEYGDAVAISLAALLAYYVQTHKTFLNTPELPFSATTETDNT